MKNIPFLTQSLLFAQISALAYKDGKEAFDGFRQLGFESEFFDCDGSQAYVLFGKNDLILAFRGTQPNELKDIIADIRIKLVPSSSGNGKVHRGFKGALDKIWPNIEPILIMNKKKKNIYFTGHSLGAAMATLAAGRCSRLINTPQPTGLFTYGSPRVGSKKYIRYLTELDFPHARWVNNIDIVTKIPLFGYRHHAHSQYLDHNGHLAKMTPLQLAIDRLKGFWTGIKRGEVNYFVNHGSAKYITNIAKNIDIPWR